MPKIKIITEVADAFAQLPCKLEEPSWMPATLWWSKPWRWKYRCLACGRHDQIVSSAMLSLKVRPIAFVAS